MTTIVHDNDWWQYQLRVVKRLQTPGINQYDAQVCKFIQTVLDIKPGQSILDLGCGSGEHVRQLASDNPSCKVIGMDISERLIDNCLSTPAPRNAYFALRDFLDDHPLSHKQDIILLLGGTFGLHYWEDDQCLLNKIGNTLNQTGKLLLQQPDLQTYIKALEQNYYWQERPEGYYLTEAYYDPISEASVAEFVFIDRDGTFHTTEMAETMNVYTFDRVQGMLEEAGLELTAAYGNILLPPTPYGADCHREMIIVAEKK